MRSKERPKYKNECTTDYITKNFSKLIGVQSNVLKHILHLCSLTSTHLLALSARRSDSKLDRIEIEIPYYGCLILKPNGNTVDVVEFNMEDEFKNNVNKAVIEGKSEFNKYIDKRLIEKLKSKYNEFA